MTNNKPPVIIHDLDVSKCEHFGYPHYCMDKSKPLRSKCCNDKECLFKKTCDLTMPFGKYKGKTILEVYNADKSYFDWLNKADLKQPFRHALETFKEALNYEEGVYVQRMFNKAKNYVNDGEIVYYVNIHCVGEEFRVKDINTEEIIGNQWFICGKQIKNKQNFDLLHQFFKKENKKMGEPSKDRGLY